ncbi:MAG: TetR/AcrR family transcriptional regulator [Actinomyces sp.]|nr:TetR/AcrR family transcriptional regulator [Actinomyces sp.]MCI1642415.1 TetR/AcrR family transcriptional regulator [Actinomyces sp.]MCI1662927.1 TetR/AcrR family transcriptional regulator [Actinomyces sp.]MCI1691521.1 TetR/AcrR family transcriptional regulator [Actinomyces sp.]MCI1787185.1 TetR/AcrR family transcriptional regulator [Actinomyces sp.]MCI1829579.1 TetR/AcrR family transcriptional regulator [Actinomyces sp.]
MGSRERLIKAMGDLMWERGFAATTPREVRERAGVGQGSMYYHFPTKRDLGVAAIERNCADVTMAADAVLNGSGSPLERLRAYLLRPRDALKGCKVGRMTQDPVVAHDPDLLAPVAQSVSTVHEDLARTIREAIDVGDLPASLDADRLARLCFATIQGGYVLALAAQDPAPFDQACSGLLDLLDSAAERRPGAGEESAASPIIHRPGPAGPGVVAAGPAA